MSLLEDCGISVPIIQAPMAGVATPDLAAAVSNAGGLGSLGLGASNVNGVAQMIDAVASLTNRPFNVNFFTNEPPKADPMIESGWLDALAPLFNAFDAPPLNRITAPYKSLLEDQELQALLIERAPPIVSFHFGLPPSDLTKALKQKGSRLLLTVTNLSEAEAALGAGMDAVVAQGIEAGGHRGIFDPTAKDAALPTATLTRLLVKWGRLPVIAAGGIMDGAGIRAALDLGAIAAQLGTAFIGCPESAANDGYRQALASQGAYSTVLTPAFSGRPARGLENRLTAWADNHRHLALPAYPIAYHAGKALAQAAQAKGEHGYTAHWAGQGAPLARSLPAASLMAQLVEEMASFD